MSKVITLNNFSFQSAKRDSKAALHQVSLHAKSSRIFGNGIFSDIFDGEKKSGRAEKRVFSGRINNSRVLSMGDKKIPKVGSVPKGSSKIGFLSLVFVLAAAIFASGAVYLYEVNDLATKGYEIKDMEKRIQELEKENKKMQIKEVELRSMYNIEKSTQDLNLVNPPEVSYIEMNNSVAMK